MIIYFHSRMSRSVKNKVKWPKTKSFTSRWKSFTFLSKLPLNPPIRAQLLKPSVSSSVPCLMGVDHITTAFRWTWSSFPILNNTRVATCSLTPFFQTTFCHSDSRGLVTAPMVPAMLPKHRAYTTSNISEAHPNRLRCEKVTAKLRFHFFDRTR